MSKNQNPKAANPRYRTEPTHVHNKQFTKLNMLNECYRW